MSITRSDIKEILQHEIDSKNKSVDRFVAAECMESAAHVAAERDGISHAMFVLLHVLEGREER